MGLKIPEEMPIQVTGGILLIVGLILILQAAFPAPRTPIYLIDSKVDESLFDSKIFCHDSPHRKSLLKTGGHADLVLNKIVQQKPNWRKYCIKNYPVFERSGKFQRDVYAQALLDAIKKPGIINTPLGTPIAHDTLALGFSQLVLEAGNIWVVSAGNGGNNLNHRCYALPACYHYDHANSLMAASTANYSNYHPRAVLAPLNISTSEAAGYFTGKLAAGMSVIEIREKYKSASRKPIKKQLGPIPRKVL